MVATRLKKKKNSKLVVLATKKRSRDKNGRFVLPAPLPNTKTTDSGHHRRRRTLLRFDANQVNVIDTNLMVNDTDTGDLLASASASTEPSESARGLLLRFVPQTIRAAFAGAIPGYFISPHPPPLFVLSPKLLPSPSPRVSPPPLPLSPMSLSSPLSLSSPHLSPCLVPFSLPASFAESFSISEPTSNFSADDCNDCNDC